MTRAMRALIVDWLMEVSNDYDLATHTLFLGVNYMDRFLSVKCVDRKDLQTAAITCLWIASCAPFFIFFPELFLADTTFRKYEEQLPPTLVDFVHTGIGTYTSSTLVKFEGLVLHHLGFALAVPTIFHFLIEYLGQLRIENKTFNQLARVRVLRCPKLISLCSFLRNLL